MSEPHPPPAGEAAPSGAARRELAEPVESGRIACAGAATVVWLRWLVPLAWCALAALSWIALPSISNLPASSLNALVPKNTPAIRTQERALKTFGVPLVAQLAVAQRDPGGLSLRDQAKIVRTAVSLDRGHLQGFPQGSFAVPIVNTLGIVPSSRESSTTGLTYLFFPQRYTLFQQTELAGIYAQRVSVPGAPAHPTGAVVGQLEESDAITGALPKIEIATVCLIVLVLGLYFRSVAAPLMTLLAAGIAYVITTGVVSWFGARTALEIPQDVEPLIVVLLLGVVTDYSVFFLAGMRNRLAAGEERLPAARRTAAQFMPIIMTAGLLVAGGVATLRVASLDFFKALGPGMALTVIIGMLVAITLMPALNAIFGKLLLWPGVRRGQPVTPAEAGWKRGESLRGQLARLVARRRVAALLAIVCGAVLMALASGLFFTRLSLTPISDLTSSAPAKQGAIAAGQGFAPGIVAPTEVVLRGPGVANQRLALARLGQELRGEPGIAAVIGAGVVPVARPFGVFRTRDGDAARFLLVFDTQPYGHDAVDTLEGVRGAMPRLLGQAGLGRARASYAGDTAIAQETVALVHRDLKWVALAAFAVNLLLLVVFLRSLVAPLYLIAASLLALAATFGLTTYIFQNLLGYGQLAYYTPLAIGVLLLSFGSDYNVFIVGRIWQHAQERPLREAITTAAPKAGRAITVAGVTLALSFATLALIPLASFREFAFAMGAGILIDTFIVRSVLIPAVASSVGWGSWWPSKRGRAPIEQRGGREEEQPAGGGAVAAGSPAAVAAARRRDDAHVADR